MKELTTSEFSAMVDELREYAAAHPINILERVSAGEGPPWAHRRDFAWRGCRVRVLLTVDRLPFPAGVMRGEHLSVLGHDGPLPNGQTVREYYVPQIETAYRDGKMPALLPGSKP